MGLWFDLLNGRFDCPNLVLQMPTSVWAIARLELDKSRYRISQKYFPNEIDNINKPRITKRETGKYIIRLNKVLVLFKFLTL